MPTHQTPPRPSAPARCRVLLACSDPRRRRTLVTALHGAVDEVDVVDTVGDGLEPAGYEAIVIDDAVATLQPPAALVRAHAARPLPVVVLIDSTKRAHLLPWIEGLAAVHVLQYDGLQRYNDLHVTLRKLASGDIFGIEKYFAWDARGYALRLSSSEEKGRVVEAAEDFSRQLCVAPRMQALVATVLDEFVSNALYNAPVDEGGAFRFRDYRRTRPVRLGDGEAIDVRFCADGRRLGVSVSDPFGSLEPENVRSAIARGLRRTAPSWDRDEGGAGLGFYCAFESVSHLVVNIDARRRTELIGILSLRDTYRDFLDSGKSFNVFEAAATPGAQAGEVRA